LVLAPLEDTGKSKWFYAAIIAIPLALIGCYFMRKKHLKDKKNDSNKSLDMENESRNMHFAADRRPVRNLANCSNVAIQD
jgi:hypothetical protein